MAEYQTQSSDVTGGSSGIRQFGAVSGPLEPDADWIHVDAAIKGQDLVMMQRGGSISLDQTQRVTTSVIVLVVVSVCWFYTFILYT